MTDSIAEVARIAAGLTKAQQYALCDELLAIRTGVYRVCAQLRRKGLLAPCYGLTALGAAVRAHLMGLEA